MQVVTLALFLHFACCTPIVTAGMATELRNHSLTTVPTNLATNLTHLNVAYNSINILNADSFPNYTKLTFLDVSENELEVIEDGTFDRQIELETLNLRYNLIRQLPSYFGPSVTKLLDGYMFGGYETTSIFNAPYFANFTRLYCLELGGMQKEIFQNTSILPTSLLRLITRYLDYGS